MTSDLSRGPSVSEVSPDQAGSECGGVPARARSVRTVADLRMGFECRLHCVNSFLWSYGLFSTMALLASLPSRPGRVVLRPSKLVAGNHSASLGRSDWPLDNSAPLEKSD